MSEKKKQSLKKCFFKRLVQFFIQFVNFQHLSKKLDLIIQSKFGIIKFIKL